MLLLSPITGAGGDCRQNAVGVADSGMQTSKTAHGEADNMSFLDTRSAHHVNNVIGGARLRVVLHILWYIRRRIAAGRIRDAAMPAREKVELRLPAPVTPAELVDKDNGGSSASRLIKELYVIAGGGKCHGDLLK